MELTGWEFESLNQGGGARDLDPGSKDGWIKSLEGEMNWLGNC